MKELLIAFLILNALFWGLMPHSVHCDLVARFTSTPCPPHMVHLTMGVACFIVAVLIAQTDYLSGLFDMAMMAVQTGGRLAESAVTFVKKSTKNINNVEDFVSKVETYVDKM
tara:strand:- start:35 stop:370 length:336 start_codon:yes stop_codon:yes gene_type:complete